MNYQEALEYLHKLCKFGINLGLERIENLLDHLGNPQLKIKTVHIAGTNGKGSTVAMLANILKAAGFKVGVYTSPHLHSYTERISINGINISHSDFAEEMAKVKAVVPQVLKATGENPTEFEILTAMAFDYFSAQKVDIAVIEVGMGGRLDSTNILLPEVCVLTGISADHIDYLGPALTDIAREKAGIIKKGIPVVSSRQTEEVLQVIREKAENVGAPLYLTEDCRYTQLSYSVFGQQFALTTPNKQYEKIPLALLGDHQLENAATAVYTIEILRSLGWFINDEAIIEGLRTVYWPGRLEYLWLKAPVIFDGAHNRAGAKVLAEAIPKYFRYKRMIFVLAILADKEREAIINLLGPIGDVFIVTKAPSARAGQWDDVVNLLRKFNKEVLVRENNQEAVDLAFAMAEEGDFICFTGSLYFLGGIREYVLKKYALS
ncbi:MAG: bifunctional folylpolyglutamate synthase/dihydrofolate synthase [Clostridia bacterium]|nr:bifunctional folylpolyglutamate synthase/dihydrofolate synthase [Clostridia bacterium]